MRELSLKERAKSALRAKTDPSAETAQADGEDEEDPIALAEETFWSSVDTEYYERRKSEVRFVSYFMYNSVYLFRFNVSRARFCVGSLLSQSLLMLFMVSVFLYAVVVGGSCGREFEQKRQR